MRRITALIVGFVALFATAGCSGHSPSLVARIGDQAITAEYVAQIDEVLKSGSEDPSVIPDGQAVILAVALAVTQEGMKLGGLTLTDEDRELVFADTPVLATFNAQGGVAQDFARKYADTLLVLNGYAKDSNGKQVNPQTFVDSTATLNIDVNPKYGSWNTETYGLDGQSGSLSKPFGQPSELPAETIPE